jgi:hypothetical protein
MFASIVQAMLKKALYGAAGSLAAFLLTIPAWHQVPPDAQGALLWSAVVVPVVTGIAGALSRFANYDPAKR